MIFELTDALMEEILFAMEDQGGYYLLDIRTGDITNPEFDTMECEDEIEDMEADDHFISLPEWSPQDGFRLMERFAAGLHNPIVQEELNSALNRGKGVFRAFKDIIGQYPETEKQWFSFKEREMKREVIGWYNALREEHGLELIGPEPEDTSALVSEDFTMREGNANDSDKAAALHKLFLEALYKNSGEDAQAIFESMNRWVFPGDICIVAVNSESEFSGYICATRCDSSSAHICALEVVSEYRGLGLGKALLGKFLEKAERDNIQNITVDIAIDEDNFSRALLLENFNPCVQRYLRKS